MSAGLLIAALIAIDELAGLASTGDDRQAASSGIDEAIGATVEPMDAATARALHLDASSKGLVVTSVAESGPAAQAGVRPGDVIDRIAGTPVESLEDAAPALARAGQAVTVRLNRHQHYAIVRLPIGRADDRRPESEERGSR